MLMRLVESAYKYFMEEVRTELKEKRQEKCRSLEKEELLGRKKKGSERSRTSADANKKVGGEQRRSAKFEKLQNHHH